MTQKSPYYLCNSQAKRIHKPRILTTLFIYLMIVLAVLLRYIRKNPFTVHLSGLFSSKRTPSMESGGLMGRRA